MLAKWVEPWLVGKLSSSSFQLCCSTTRWFVKRLLSSSFTFARIAKCYRSVTSLPLYSLAPDSARLYRFTGDRMLTVVQLLRGLEMSSTCIRHADSHLKNFDNVFIRDGVARHPRITVRWFATSARFTNTVSFLYVSVCWGGHDMDVARMVRW
jgi:hypothetical protein